MAIDITTGGFVSSWKWVSFKEVAAGLAVQQLLLKDETTGKQKILIQAVQLGCCTGHVHVYDGSLQAAPVFSCAADGSYSANRAEWDFGKDPVELTNTDGTALCISAVGTITGFIKYAWGS